MNTRQNRSWRIWAMLLMAAGIPLYIAYDLHAAALAAALDAHDQLQICRQQAAEIEQIRQQPKFAALAVLTDQELSERVRSARDAAGIAESAVDLIDPQQPVAIGRSAYLRRPVAIDLRSISLKQVAVFVDRLTDVESGMWVSQLRLSPVRQMEADHELWNTELVLTQLLFSPTSR